MLDAHQLNVFLTAARSLNFTVAARQLHMTQPSVSQHIQSLEQQFEIDLFLRTGRHLRLTDAGEALLPMAANMVAQSRNIENRMAALQGDVYGRLRVGCSTTVGKYVLPFLLAEFMKLYPNVEASCLVAPPQKALEMLCAGDVHVALASSMDTCSTVTFKQFISDKIVLIVPLDHPWVGRGRVELDELFAETFIWREDGSGTQAVVERGLQAFGVSIEQLKTVLTLGNSEAIALAVQEGIGVGFVSQMIVTRLVEDKVAVVEVRGLDLCQDIFIGRDRNGVGTTAQNAFWEFVTDPFNPVLHRLQNRSVSYAGELFTAVSEAIPV